MKTLERADLERQRHWLGQRLRSRDLNDQRAGEAQRRWWHNRALHGAFGVAGGLEPEKAGNAVRVSPGTAYDAFGRELVLSAERTLPLPPADPAEPRGWTLLAAIAGPRAGEPELRWRPTRRVTLADGVPLIRVDAQLEPLDGGSRPLARPLARPRIGHGSTVAGQTAWRAWTLPLGDNFGGGGIEVTIDASAAGFTEVPCYFAWLQGGSPRAVPVSVSVPAASTINRAFVVPFALDRILDATAESFVFSLWDLNTREFGNLAVDALLRMARQQLFVCWLGILTETADDPLHEVDHGNP
ncbi:MAG TPA: hypothetical protein VGC93_05695 [Thermoanaerobaculia bacterium]|jgi:hypothetical protein